MEHVLFPAVLLDRDGVINRPIIRDGELHAPKNLEEFEFLPGVHEQLERLASAGLKLIVVTNQTDAQSPESRHAVARMHEHIRRSLPVIDVLTCFEDDPESNERCKPRPGLTEEAVARHKLDLSRSFTIGDAWRDIVASQKAGCATSILILTPFSEAHRCKPSKTVHSLKEAVDYILESIPGSAVSASLAAK